MESVGINSAYMPRAAHEDNAVTGAHQMAPHNTPDTAGTINDITHS